MKTGRKGVIFGLLFALVSTHSVGAAETLDSLIAGAKKEPEFTFIAGAQTFGGQKTLSLLNPRSIKNLVSTARFVSAPARR